MSTPLDKYLASVKERAEFPSLLFNSEQAHIVLTQDIPRLVAMVEVSLKMIRDLIEARMCGNRCKCALCETYDEIDRIAASGGEK